jgi:hypothetical protein
MRLILIKYGNIVVHSEFIRLLFLQTHRETYLFFATSGVQVVQSTSGIFHFHHVTFSSTLKSKVGSTLVKTVVLRITLNIDVVPSLQEHILTHHTLKHLVY